ncbi:MAG: rRNA maturation RNase YbeY [Lachnospiraceae bacterium]|nr:rRNA maturation RNase YbeY [Lachnospiraceae bacterium]
MIFYVENDFDPAFEEQAGIHMEELCGRIGEEVFRSEQLSDFAEKTEVSLYLVSESAIRELNLMHRNINAATDVLSFPNIDLSEEPACPDAFRHPSADDLDPETGCVVLGDIVICVPRVFSQASEYGHSPKREFAFLLTHSLFHLLGYDHETPEEAAMMEEKQETVLTCLGITRGQE